MPPSSSGPYQSRLFNFLNRQSIRLTDQFDRTVRQIKVAATWGAQVLLYPIYLLVQGTLSVGRQIAAEPKAELPQLKESTHQQPQETPPASDTPIQRVLSEINTLALPETSGIVVAQSGILAGVIPPESEALTVGKNVESSTLQPSESAFGLDELSENGSEEGLAAKPRQENRCIVRGVATFLETRSLVLVAEDNQILDILTPQQQQQLASKIHWEVADLLHQRRLADSSKRQNRTQLLSSLDRPGVFRPMRAFWKIMAWVQTSRVATALNLFQESTLVESKVLRGTQQRSLTPVPQPQHQLPLLDNPGMTPQLPPTGVLAVLDHTVAELESHQLVPGTEAVVTFWDSLRNKWLAWREANPSSASLAPREGSEQLRQQVKTPVRGTKDATEATSSSQTSPFQIQALIYAAIDYFFGRGHSEELPGTESQSQGTILPNSKGKAHRLSGRHSKSLPQRQNLQLPDAGEPDPWLSWDDLFGTSDAQELAKPPRSRNQRTFKQPNAESPAQLPEAMGSKIPVRSGKSIWQFLKGFLNPRHAPGKLSAPKTEKEKVASLTSVAPTGKLNTVEKASPPQVQSKSKQSVVPVESQNTSISPAQAENTALTTPSDSSPNTDLVPAPDWIETRVTPAGYVKHPLEQILEWLDLAIVRVEEFVVKVWHWVTQMKDKS